jgi:signal peptidase I
MNKLEKEDLKSSHPKSTARSILSLFTVIATSLALAIILASFVFQRFDVVGNSMKPTIHDGDIILVNKVPVSKSKLTGKTYIPERGDIIVFESPLAYGSSKDKNIIKRVIAFPGERVNLKDGKFTVYNQEHPNGFDPDSAYKDTLPHTDGEVNDLVVPEGHLFVSGDNRTSGESLDSRNALGTVPLKNIIGEAWLRVYPFGDAKNFYKK